jgi:hypothetical protein
MMVILPIKSGPYWIPVAPSGYAAELQGAELAVGYRLKNLSNIMEPIIAEHAMGRADQATTRLSIKAALTGNGKLPYFEIDGVRQELDSEWLDVVIKTNTDIVCGYRSFVQGMDPEMLEAYPARELVKAKNGEEPYDWKIRWAESGGQLYDGRMIALKNHPVWLNISDLGHPHPPFAFGSGMDVVDISRVEAVELQLIGWRSDILVAPCPICDSDANSCSGEAGSDN